MNGLFPWCTCPNVVEWRGVVSLRSLGGMDGMLVLFRLFL